MKGIIDKTENSLTYLPSVWISGICLLISFTGEYIIPFFGDGSRNIIMVNHSW